ncbi:MAG: MiaB/RimO family radical SAM methylthiotransferase, partial [Clostridiales bacterium]
MAKSTDKKSWQKGTFAIYTLGCKVNQEESAALAMIFTNGGYQQRDFKEKADIYIINTCTVTHLADRKARGMIRRAIKSNQQALVIVTGCYAQTAPEEIAVLQGVDLIVGVDERSDLLALAEKELAKKAVNGENQQDIKIMVGDILQPHAFVPLPAVESQKRTRAYLKIEDGCDQFCHYCVIPYARGPVRSLPLAEAVARAEKLFSSGHRELVLTGIHVGAYGQDLPGKVDLLLLLQKLLALPFAGRIHLGSVEPHQFNRPLLELLASSQRICRHLHIPLQAGSDRTLAAMGRTYTCGEYQQLVDDLRSLLPGIAISSDVMVGYPGESAEDF